MKPVAVLDACVLFPSRQRDVLLEMAKSGDLYRPLWSERILRELDNAIKRRRSSVGYPAVSIKQELEHLRCRLSAAFPGSWVADWQAHENSFVLPDPNDRHVVAVAVAGGASWIVTENLRDFPSSALPTGVQACGIDAFLCRLLEEDEEAVWSVLQEISRRSGRKGPRFSVDELVDMLGKRYGATEFAARLG